MSVPDLRVSACNTAPPNPHADYVLYWMIANRRTQWNFSLQRAVDYVVQWHKPLLVLEALRCDYPWASERFHRFVIEGMHENAGRLGRTPAFYYPYVEPEPGAGKGLLAALAARACVVVTDDFPAFMLPRMIAAAARQVPVRMEKVDSNGLWPMRATDQVFPTAYAFRRFLQKHLHAHLLALPLADPLQGLKLPRLGALPGEILQRWPPAEVTRLLENPAALAKLPIDHRVAAVPTRGGSTAGREKLQTFLERRLARYAEERNQPEQEVTSGLSPYLHFGHLSVHEVFTELMQREQWSPALLPPRGNGAKAGWWGVRPAAEAFLDELITWRELGYNFCCLREDYDQYESLPAWARASLDRHARDRRSYIYSLAQFEQAATHDPLWNAAQRQLVTEGRIHNYLRMLWGKKILEWSRDPREALAIMIELNNKYALDGRNPNSYSGIFWVLGRYDRPWGPERPIFGVIRYMSSENTTRKVRVREYIQRYTGNPPALFE
ncbi:MAG: deoxyribodipyrimidine photolyase [candidate division KSB1 bacterium]|nr:deoxyribodipyrimidine photolyase [candidate division KSB1 bacterium]MDZ7272643.1 deoxyribodipyrimidine photolyase [candidate division KSB1 bacterium]MDZ7284335.1 deoxyribodipyrimidine photolyase [candidate division KSB1 bacterium]MDZ7297269.1 deoxyribodipyrimidine photolyase [candidate division KSB1 bacterium]MDZ7309042.1 deoxyribodipyrimidine photolyase [candidate division KSB1 bacterium]